MGVDVCESGARPSPGAVRLHSRAAAAGAVAAFVVHPLDGVGGVSDPPTGWGPTGGRG